MKKELTSIEIKYLVEELQQLKDSRVEKIYQPEKKELILVLHLSGRGRQMVRISLPNFIWIAKAKPKMPEKVRGFCALLRKTLERAFLRKIEQIESERVIRFEFDAKQGRYSLIFELFSKGNAVLCQDKKIIMPLEVQEWKDRTIKKGEEYVLPSKKHNPFKLTISALESALESKETISKTLATKIGLGGVYAEEICLRAGIDKKKKKPTEAEIKKIHKELKALLKQKPEPVIVLDKGKVVDITPVKLKIYSDYENKSSESYSKALDSILSAGVEEEKVTQVEDKFQKKLDSINKRIEMQEKNLKDMQDKMQKSQRKGEMIYEKYQELQKLLAKIKEMRKEQSWKEIKEKLKSVKYIKQINEKTGEIVLEIK